MTPKEAISWLVDTNLELARQYRCAIELEIWHTKRIYGMKLPDDARRLLKQSLKEIPLPSYPTPPNRETAAELWAKVRKPNWEKIRQEYLDEVNTY